MEPTTQQHRACHRNIKSGWSTQSPAAISLPNPRFGHTAVVHGDYMIVFAGRDRNFFNDTWRLHIPSKTWQEVLFPPFSAKPEPRAGHTAVLVDDTMIVFGGGTSATRCTNDVCSLDLKTMTWKVEKKAMSIAQMGQQGVVIPSERKGHTAGINQTEDGGKEMIIFGGCGGDYPGDNAVWKMSLVPPPAKRKSTEEEEKGGSDWSILKCTGDVPTSRMYHVSEIDTVSQKMLVFGGRSALSERRFYGDLAELALDTGCWRTVETKSIAPSQRMCASSFLQNGKFCVFFGGATRYLQDSFEFDVRKREWNTLDLGPSARTRPTTIIYHNTIVMFGGCHNNTFLNELVEMELEPPSLKEVCRQWLQEAQTVVKHADEAGGKEEAVKEHSIPLEVIPCQVLEYLQES